MTGNTVAQSMFDDSLMLRAPQKAVLADAMWSSLPPDIAWPTGEVRHVLDGGATYKGHTVFQHIENYDRCIATMCLNILSQPSSWSTVTAIRPPNT